MNTYFIHLKGIVQGVGFRPMVYELAVQNNLSGAVSNSSSGVEIFINASESEATAFYELVLSNLPPRSKVVEHSIQQVASQKFESFGIIDSESNQPPIAFLSPDFALCESCRKELHDAKDKRYEYAFITCTQCGPRYSILNQLPYDRIRTSMSAFEMCEVCSKEYKDSDDKRFYSQTNSCEKCGVVLTLFVNGEKYKTNTVEQTVALILAGKTVAVKGIGGYLLLCDATNEKAIRTLRDRKNRPTKPLAVLYPNPKMLHSDVALSDEALKVLQGEVSPILLTPLLSNPASEIQTSLITPGLRSLGVMLPYAPLLELIATKINRPLVATSANLSHQPIVYNDAVAMEGLSSLADAILIHNREIVIPQDDSVIRLTNNLPIVIRRARGLAPSFFSKISWTDKTVLAMGAQLKSTVTLLHKGNVYVSQYLGDLESIEAEKNYRAVIDHLLKITQAHPEIIIIDKHPSYTSSEIGKALAVQYSATVQHVQHHAAHFAAVVAENNLKENILGVIWDGVGLGTDGNFWGGEFFIWDNHTVQRVDHFTEFPLLLGDKMAREPRLSALALSTDEFKPLLKNQFTETEWRVYNSLLKVEQYRTDSVGRLFDAVSAWCGVGHQNSYEGEAALLLEELASTCYEKNPTAYNPFRFSITSISSQSLVKEVSNALQCGTSTMQVAFQFHCTLVEIIRQVAHKHNVRSLAFSGGVFQNALLVTLIQKQLKGKFNLHFHQQLSPNDECISFGQLAYSQWMCPESELVESRTIKETMFQ